MEINRLKELAGLEQLNETAAYYPLSLSEAKILVKYLEEMDKAHDGIPALVQNVAELLHAFIKRTK